MSKYSKELKEEVIKKHLKEGRSQKSLEAEYKLGSGTVKYWIKTYRKECTNDEHKQSESLEYREFLKLKRQIEELKKENEFLKKASAFFAKQI